GQVSGLGESILSEIKSILNMNSPSRAMAEIGEGAVAGLIQGAESKQGDLSSAYEGLGKAALDAMESASNPQARSVGETIGDTTVDGATSVNYAAIPDAITSAIDGGRGNVNSSVDALVSDIERNFQTMKEQCSRLAQDMMTQMHTAITTKTTPIHGAVDAVKTGVVNGLTPLQTDIPRVTTEAMNGAYLAFSNGANRLIERARATAAAVAAIMASTLQVNSPSRVMIDLFSNVMDGIYVGMERGEDTVLKKAGDIADKLANTLTLEPDLIDNMVCKMQAIVRTGVISSPRNMLVPAGAVAGKGTSPVGTTHNHTYNTYVTSPKPLSEYQISRQIENMSRRMQRQL
ncbi:MAG: hypothetical protein FWD84_06090, partial [Oscillospiraceae bacterium]|nr:hypothetical protein [Oscillospiraceae bacterium]